MASPETYFKIKRIDEKKLNMASYVIDLKKIDKLIQQSSRMQPEVKTWYEKKQLFSLDFSFYILVKSHKDFISIMYPKS